MTVACLFWFNWDLVQAGQFFVVTYLAHFVTDAVTSRISSYFYKKGDTHNFFVIIGFDQWLHAL